MTTLFKNLLSEKSDDPPEEHPNIHKREKESDLITYEDVEKKGVIVKVIATLSGSKSAKATVLAKKYKELDDKFKEAKDARDSSNLEITDFILEHFDTIEDAALTRVVQTCQLTLQLSKSEAAQSIEVVDYEAVCGELTKFLSEELIEVLDGLIKKYTTIEKTTASKPRLTVKTEALIAEAGVVAALKRMLEMFIKNTLARLQRIDTKLEKIAAKFHAQPTWKTIKIEPNTARRRITD